MMKRTKVADRPKQRFEIGQFAYLYDSTTDGGRMRKYPLLAEKVIVVGYDWDTFFQHWNMYSVTFGKNFFGGKGSSYHPLCTLRYAERSYHSVPPTKDMRWFKGIGWSKWNVVAGKYVPVR